MKKYVVAFLSFLFVSQLTFGQAGGTSCSNAVTLTCGQAIGGSTLGVIPDNFDSGNFEGTAGESNVIPGAADQSVFDHLKKLKDQRFETANSHWLKGYPKVTKQLPGSPNAVSSVDDVAINLESQIAKLKEQEVLAEESRKALWSEYKAGNITAEDYTVGANKLYSESNPRFELEAQLRNLKADESRNIIKEIPQQNILKSKEKLC